ncbi:MAG TPA: hypothetical protein VMN36_18440 [Verrucomicrobiales bacterium]|nr:hypothetical protein [Verrucomicrobiales bacterium]
MAAFLGYLRHQEFPSAYHRDEPSKVEQVQEGFRNLYHPVLLLETVELVRRSLGLDRQDAEAVARLGRTVSAAFMAAAAAALVLAAGWRYSLGAGIWAGILGGVHFRFYDVAHYFKEDTPYLAGCALFLAAAMRWRERPGEGSAIFLGLAAGIALSAKYSGLAHGVIGVLLLWVTAGRGAGRKGKMLAVYAAAMALVLGAAHFRVLIDPEVWGRIRGSLLRETDWMLRGHEGVGQRVPHPLYLWQMYMDHRLPLLLLLGCLWPLRRMLGRTDAVVLGSHAVYLAALSCTAKYSERYLLPVYLVLFVYAAAAAMELWRRRPRDQGWRGRAAVAAGAGFAVYLLFHPVYMLVQTDRLFREDSRAQLCAFLEEEVPGTAVLAADGDVMLDVALGRAGLRPRRIRSAVYASDLGTIAGLRESGVTHAVVTYDSFHRFVGWGTGAAGGQEEEWDRAREFYAVLRGKGRLLWSSPPAFPKVLHPGIELYALPDRR